MMSETKVALVELQCLSCESLKISCKVDVKISCSKIAS